MEKEIIVARQPILNAKNELFAYELLYRDVENDNIIMDHRAATANLLVHILNQFGLKKMLGSFPAFIKIDGSFLMQDMIYSIPKEHFYLALFENIVLSGAILERIAYFYKEGYRFAINDTALHGDELIRLEPILKYVSFCKIDTRDTDFTLPVTLEKIAHLRELGVQCIATKVENHQTYQNCLDAGFGYFQGYYFSRPKLLTNRIYDADKASVMKIWRLVVADASVQDIANAFEETPVLSVQLLSYINSAAFHFKAPIRSIQQVLTLLGRMPLMQWLLLTINARKLATPEEQVPLQMLLLNRIEIMLGLYRLLPDKQEVESSEVHFVGLLSFIDILMGVPLSSVLEELHVDEEIQSALLNQSGLLGELLKAARAIEYFDMASLEAFLEAYGIAVDDVINLTLKTIEKVNSFETSL